MWLKDKEYIAQAWYDGYELVTLEGNYRKTYAMYSPKSVVDAMLSGIYDNYWNQTEIYEALKIYISMNVDALKDYHGNLLLAGINYDKDTKKHSCVIEKYEIER